jgi:hypothetical protein
MKNIIKRMMPNSITGLERVKGLTLEGLKMTQVESKHVALCM